ncbi:signal peptidase II [Roseicitreum antarcticum]|uniref:Lipoprotein signal peptidase n=2 Tax=Roseicitreum antarcticum TaxID=564137 RepID=A0A1H2SDM5_9RHOB|nr:signal peptidase II [Roseicitreum antarcticum]
MNQIDRTPARHPMKYIIGAAALIFVIDQLTKWYVVFELGLQHRLFIEVFDPYLNFSMAWNTGVNFGLFGGGTDVMRWVLIAVALGISGWVWVWVRRDPRPGMLLSAGVLIGGALGNVVDRVLYGAVADFLNMSCCGLRNPFAFNVADVAIFAGAIGLAVFSGRADGAAGDKTP